MVGIKYVVALFASVMSVTALKNNANNLRSEKVGKGKPSIEGWFPKTMWNTFFVGSLNHPLCVAGAELFSYESFLESYKEFDVASFTRTHEEEKLSLAMILAHASLETNGGWPTAEYGEFAYGLCRPSECTKENEKDQACVHCTSTKEDCMWSYGFDCPCSNDASYYGRGPHQITGNGNYASFSNHYLKDPLILLQNPDLVLDNPRIAWASAMWFAVTTQAPKPNMVNALFGRFDGEGVEFSEERPGGFGLTNNVINAAVECGPEKLNYEAAKIRRRGRIEFFKRYAKLLGVEHMINHDTLDCGYQKPYGQ